jgi:hypothetical protein
VKGRRFSFLLRFPKYEVHGIFLLFTDGNLAPPPDHLSFSGKLSIFGKASGSVVDGSFFS